MLFEKETVTFYSIAFAYQMVCIRRIINTAIIWRTLSDSSLSLMLSSLNLSIKLDNIFKKTPVKSPEKGKGVLYGSDQGSFRLKFCNAKQCKPREKSTLEPAIYPAALPCRPSLTPWLPWWRRQRPWLPHPGRPTRPVRLLQKADFAENILLHFVQMKRGIFSVKPKLLSSFMGSWQASWFSRICTGWPFSLFKTSR